MYLIIKYILMLLITIKFKFIFILKLQYYENKNYHRFSNKFFVCIDTLNWRLIYKWLKFVRKFQVIISQKIPKWIRA